MKYDQFFEENFIFSRSWDIVNQFIWKKNNKLTNFFWIPNMLFQFIAWRVFLCFETKIYKKQDFPSKYCYYWEKSMS